MMPKFYLKVRDAHGVEVTRFYDTKEHRAEVVKMVTKRGATVLAKWEA